MTLPAVGPVTALLAFVMIVNASFGFEGVQRFARFVAVPVIVIRGVFATILACTTVAAETLAGCRRCRRPSA